MIWLSYMSEKRASVGLLCDVKAQALRQAPPGHRRRPRDPVALADEQEGFLAGVPHALAFQILFPLGTFFFQVVLVVGLVPQEVS